MLDFTIRSTSLYNPISMVFEKKDSFPLLSYRYLSIIKLYPRIFRFASPFERSIIETLVKQGVLTTFEKPEECLHHTLTSEYLLKMLDIDLGQDQLLMNVSASEGTPAHYIGIPKEELFRFQAFLAQMYVDGPIPLEFEVQPFEEESSPTDTTFSKVFFDVKLVVRHAPFLDGETAYFDLTSHLMNVCVNLLNRGATSLNVVSEEKQVTIVPSLFGRYGSLPEIVLLPE